MDIIGQFEASNTKAIEEAKEVLTLNLPIFYFFFSIESTKIDFCVRRTEFSQCKQV